MRLPEDARTKISNAHKGRKQSAEHVGKRASSHRGKKRSPETGARISAAKKGKPLSEAGLRAAAAASVAMRGRKMPLDTIALGAAKRVGRRHSEETKARMRDAALKRIARGGNPMSGRSHTAEAREKISLARRTRRKVSRYLGW